MYLNILLCKYNLSYKTDQFLLMIFVHTYYIILTIDIMLSVGRKEMVQVNFEIDLTPEGYAL